MNKKLIIASTIIAILLPIVFGAYPSSWEVAIYNNTDDTLIYESSLIDTGASGYTGWLTFDSDDGLSGWEVQTGDDIHLLAWHGVDASAQDSVYYDTVNFKGIIDPNTNPFNWPATLGDSNWNAQMSIYANYSTDTPESDPCDPPASGTWSVPIGCTITTQELNHHVQYVGTVYMEITSGTIHARW